MSTLHTVDTVNTCTFDFTCKIMSDAPLYTYMYMYLSIQYIQYMLYVIHIMYVRVCVLTTGRACLYMNTHM